MVVLVRNQETTCILLAAALRLALRANALHVHGRGGGLAACGATDGGISQTQKPPTAIRHPTLCATLRARTASWVAL